MEDEYYAPATSDAANLDQILEDGLFLGSQTAAINRDLLELYNVKTVLTIAKHIAPPFPDRFTYYVYEVYDRGDEDLLSHFPQMCEEIASGLKKGGVLVHCANGISRSPTVVAAYLMHTKKLRAVKALDYISSRRHVNPNQGFRDQLVAFEKLI